MYKVIGEHWFAGDAKFSPNEIECAGEVRTAEQLAVELPADNLDFQKLAEGLTQNLPLSQKPSREQLQAVLRLPGGKGKLERTVGERTVNGAAWATQLKFRVDDAWTVPAVELSTGSEAGTTLVLADGGRKAAAEEIGRLLAAGQRVVAIDPFYLGESKIDKKDFLFALLVSSVGERPLGVQVHQLRMIARQLKAESPTAGVRIHAIGPRTSLMALAAAACDEKSIDGVSLHGSLGSLKEVIEQGGQVDKTPEQFCFGLLATADIAQMATLVAPREVKFVEPSERSQKEFAGLKDVYQQLGKQFDPLAP